MSIKMYKCTECEEVTEFSKCYREHDKCKHNFTYLALNAGCGNMEIKITKGCWICKKNYPTKSIYIDIEKEYNQNGETK